MKLTSHLLFISIAINSSIVQMKRLPLYVYSKMLEFYHLFDVFVPFRCLLLIAFLCKVPKFLYVWDWLCSVTLQSLLKKKVSLLLYIGYCLILGQLMGRYEAFLPHNNSNNNNNNYYYYYCCNYIEL